MMLSCYAARRWDCVYRGIGFLKVRNCSCSRHVQDSGANLDVVTMGIKYRSSTGIIGVKVNGR